MNKLLTKALLFLLATTLVSCASYEPGKYPLTDAEVAYFSRVDPNAAVVSDLGKNTFDVFNPTLHAAIGHYEAGAWPERNIPFSESRFFNILLNAYDFRVGLAYSKAIAEKCHSMGLERSESTAQRVGEYTIRYKCLEANQWVTSETSSQIQLCQEGDTRVFDIQATRHVCAVDTRNYSQNFCDLYSSEIGYREDESFSCRDLVTSYGKKVSANQRIQESISSQDQCKAFGFTDDTPEMANCLLELYKIANQPQQNTVITNSAPARTNSSDTTSGIELMNRGLQILNGVGTPSAPRSRTSTCTRIGDLSGQVVTFNNIACPAGYVSTF